jgi:transposase-like protein
VKVAGRWRYVYRAVDQRGQIIDVFVSPRRDTTAARRFFETALGAHGMPVEVVTDRSPALRVVIEERFAEHLLDAWSSGSSSLLPNPQMTLTGPAAPRSHGGDTTVATRSAPFGARRLRGMVS